MFGSKLLGPEGMVMVEGTTHGEWGQSSMLGVDKAGVGIEMGSTVLVGGGGHCFGIVPNVE